MNIKEEAEDFVVNLTESKTADFIRRQSELLEKMAVALECLIQYDMHGDPDREQDTAGAAALAAYRGEQQ